LLPQDNITIPGYKVTGFTLPAKTIGGDFYDIIKINENKFILLVADVSGKGIPSAIYMSKIQAMIQFAATEFENPMRILSEVNKQIFHNIERKYFVTILAGLLDIEKRNITFCRAGHNPVLFVKNSEVHILKSTGIALGLENGEMFDKFTEEKILAIENEDLYLFYNDGITEAMNTQREEFGEERLIKCLKQNINSEPNEIKNKILEELNNFREGNIQNDDLTLLIIKKI
jgi:sigma-B regulation protein RsbU (phosphoserine phosphatase)